MGLYSHEAMQEWNPDILPPCLKSYLGLLATVLMPDTVFLISSSYPLQHFMQQRNNVFKVHEFLHRITCSAKYLLLWAFPSKEPQNLSANSLPFA